MKSKLGGNERIALFSSVSLFKEGLVSLYQTLQDSTSLKDNKPTGGGSLAEAFKTAAVVASGAFQIAPLSERLDNIELSADLQPAAKQALEDAKSKFKATKEKAANVFSCAALSGHDRITATRIRLMATILQHVEQPTAALDECQLCLKELHAAPAVREAFTELLKKGLKSFFKKERCAEIFGSVCHLNQVVFEFSLMVGWRVVGWPCVDVGKSRIRPVADAKVGHMLREVNLRQYDVQLSFGQGGKTTEEKLVGAEDVTFNSEDQCIVADLNGHKIKVFSSSGVYLYSFVPTAEENQIFCPLSVATDVDNNLYVLANMKPLSGGKEWRGVITFDRYGNVAHKLPLTDMFVGWSLAISSSSSSSSSKMFILGMQQTRKTSWQEVQVYDLSGKSLYSFGKGHVADGAYLAVAPVGDVPQVFITDFGDECVHIFDDQGNFLRQFKTQGKLVNAGGLAFRLANQQIVIASISTHGGQVELYEMNSTLDHIISLDTEEDPILKGVAVMNNGLVTVVDKTQQRIHIV